MAHKTQYRGRQFRPPSEPYSPYVSQKQRDFIKSMYERLIGYLTNPSDEALIPVVATAIAGVEQRIAAVLTAKWEDLPTAVDLDNNVTVNDLRLTKGEASTMIGALKPVFDMLPAPQPTGDAIDLRGLISGKYAVPFSDTRLKIQIDVVTTGKWAGWVFVKDAAVYGYGKKYGSQRPNEFYKGDIQDELRAILLNPKEAMAEYGRITKVCGMCGLPLENEESVNRGLGPVCASKF